jgi:hypothetical protein
MTNLQEQTPESLDAEIVRLQERLQELLTESPVMDDEVNAVERDLQALIQRQNSA